MKPNTTGRPTLQVQEEEKMYCWPIYEHIFMFALLFFYAKINLEIAIFWTTGKMDINHKKVHTYLDFLNVKKNAFMFLHYFDHMLRL